MSMLCCLAPELLVCLVGWRGQAVSCVLLNCISPPAVLAYKELWCGLFDCDAPRGSKGNVMLQFQRL